jgi:hypothetical protein
MNYLAPIQTGGYVRRQCPSRSGRSSVYWPDERAQLADKAGEPVESRHPLTAINGTLQGRAPWAAPRSLPGHQTDHCLGHLAGRTSGQGGLTPFPAVHPPLVVFPSSDNVPALLGLFHHAQKTALRRSLAPLRVTSAADHYVIWKNRQEGFV